MRRLLPLGTQPKRLRFLTLLLAALATAGLATAPAAFGATITLTGTTEVTSGARDASVAGIGEDNEFPLSLPSLGTAIANHGGASSATAFELSDFGFLITFDHVRPTTLFSNAESHFFVDFVPSSTVNYVLEGQYQAVDPLGNGIRQFVHFEDLSSPVPWLIYSNQESLITPNENFVLGEAGGDQENQLVGSITGTLIAGHEYRLGVHSYLFAEPGAPIADATASGYFSLAFVPEPSVALLCGLGLAGLVAHRRLRA